MKKLLVVLMVLAFVAPAMADDTLDASGSMRVEAYSISNNGFGDDDSQDLDYWDQRFRMQLRFTPADGVSATVRTDITENAWGRLQGSDTSFDGFRPGLAVSPTGTTTAGGANGILMIDRAYLSIDKGMVNINAGLNTFNLGNGHAYNNQGQGIQVTVKTPLVIRLGYTKESENGSNSDKEDANKDIDTMFADLGFKNDMMAVNVFYGAVTDGRSGDNPEPNVIGAIYKGAIGPVNLMAELDVFGGKAGPGVDYTGTQFIADASMKLSDALTLGSHVIYAAGNKDDDKQTITAVVDFADVVYQDAVLPQNGPGSLQPLGSSDLFDVTNADSTAASGQGAMGIAPYVKFQVMDDLMLAAHVAYLAKAEDAADPTIEIDSAFYYGIGASWALAPSAKLDFGYTAASLSEGSDFVGDLETYSAFGAILSVSF
jgi:hypothetical protein